MNNNKRFLILDSKNNAQRPCDHGLHLPNVQSDKSPSFTSKATAIAFGALLASKYKGARFYLAEVLSGVVAYDAVDPERTAAAQWTETTESAV